MEMCLYGLLSVKFSNVLDAPVWNAHLSSVSVDTRRNWEERQMLKWLLNIAKSQFYTVWSRELQDSTASFPSERNHLHYRTLPRQQSPNKQRSRQPRGWGVGGGVDSEYVSPTCSQHVTHAHALIWVRDWPKYNFGLCYPQETLQLSHRWPFDLIVRPLAFRVIPNWTKIIFVLSHVIRDCVCVWEITWFFCIITGESASTAERERERERARKRERELASYL